ncbi:MAG: B12-binding domain-containing radical SAM protein, partial [Vallitaleaceae bacterium]|nr:B12-binding domain-containing radical SAM protein [Vallitaleaceae bacterium]
MKKRALLVGINAKYIHSNLAIRYIRAYVEEQEKKEKAKEDLLNYDVLCKEYSINQSVDYILHELIASIEIGQGDCIALSCYIWNIEYVHKLIRSLKQIDESLVIVLGGPEVSYSAKEEMEAFCDIDYILQGEGEKGFYELLRALQSGKALSMIPSLAYRVKESVVINPAAIGMPMDEIPFPYKDFAELENRIIYYESSRGCPFSCQYCLSSIEKGVRFRSLELVKKEIDFFIEHKVRQVKLVDRTFNAKKEHAHGMMEYIIDKDFGYTNFHFEVAPELVDQEFLNILKQARSGLFQLEIGVQTTNEETLRIIQRKNDFAKIDFATRGVKAIQNTHIHLDLIAGLPGEDYASFGRSFDYVYGQDPDQLQLGFLKLLKGAGLNRVVEEYGLVAREYPPYEILYTKALPYKEALRLKGIEEMVESFYNSGQFHYSIRALVQRFHSPFSCFEALADAWFRKGKQHEKHQKLDLYEFFYDFACEQFPAEANLWKEILSFDYAVKEKPRKHATWMEVLQLDVATIKAVLDAARKENLWEEQFQTYDSKQLSRMFYFMPMP